MARKKRGTSAKRKPARNIVVVSKTRHRAKKRRAVRGTAVGSTAVGRRHHTKKRKKRAIGTTAFKIGNFNLKEMGKIALGITAGLVVNNKVAPAVQGAIRAHMPWVDKIFGIVQAGTGFMIAVKAKGMGGKAFGITVMGGGVNATLKQFNVDKYVPGISGPSDDWQTLKIPMNGTELKSMVAGLLTDNKTPDLPMVADGNTSRRRRQSYADTFKNTESNANPGGSAGDYRLRSFVGESDYDYIMPAKGSNF